MAPEKRPTKEDTMRRTHRALAMLTLGLALVTATTAAAAATPPTAPQHRADQLAQRQALYQSELDQNLQLRNRPGYGLLVEQGLLSTKAAAEQARSMERNLTPVPARAAAPPAARTDRAVPGQDMDVLATLLLGLVGGLVGGGAAMAGWTTATRRRTHRAATT
jgi:hypothetical protein